MATLNIVHLIGYLGKDIELKYSQNNTAIANISLATDESYTDRDGNKVQRTEWHRVVVYSRTAENCAQFLSKGSLVYVEGSLQTRKWEDQNGVERYTTEIKGQRVQFLDRKESDKQSSSPPRQSESRQQGRRGQAPSSGHDPLDEVPF